MELNDLKSTWEKYSSNEESRHQFGEDDLQYMLKKRTKTLIDTLDKKFKIGVSVLIILTIYFIVDDYILGPLMAKSEGIALPNWIFWLDTAKSLFIITAFVSFILKYRHVRKDVNHHHDIKMLLKSMLRLLKTYKILFYLGLGILLITFTVSYITGMFAGIELSAYKQGVSIYELNRNQAFQLLATGLLVIISIVIVLFFLLRWIFRRLYGRYIIQLKETLNELEEAE